MDLKKLKRILAEGNPDKQLDNILENLSEASKIPLERQMARAQSAEARANMAKRNVAIKQLEVAETKGKDPVAYNELLKAQAKAEVMDAKADAARSFVGETMKGVRKGDRDPMTGQSIKEEHGTTNIVSDDALTPNKGGHITVVKFGSKVDDEQGKENLEPSIEAPDPETEDYDQDGILDKNEEEIIMKKEQKDLFEQSMENIFKILKEEDEEKTEEEVKVGEVPAVESPEVEEEKEEESLEVEEKEEELPAEEEESEEEKAPEAEEEKEEESPEAEEEKAPEVEEEKEEEELPAEVEEAVEESESEVVEVPVEVEPEVMVDEKSIKIHIPLSSGEKLVPEMSEEESEALQEAFRTVYRLLASEGLLEGEGHEVEIPEEAEAKIEVEGDHLVVEIPLKDPKDEVSEEEAEELQEAVAVISFLLKEELGEVAAEPVHSEEEPVEHTPEASNDDVIEGQHAEEIKPVVTEAELGDAAAEPVHDQSEPVEHTPEASNDDVIEGQHAEEIKEIVVESEAAEPSEPAEEKYEVEEEIAPSDAPEAKVTASVEGDKVVIDDHDHADDEGKEVRDELHSNIEKAESVLSKPVEFDVDAEHEALKDSGMSEEEKLEKLAEAYALKYFVALKEEIEESGFSTTEKGVVRFFESKGVELEQEEKDGIFKSINSEAVKKAFEEHYQSKRHLDIEEKEITNKDMETGMKAEDVKSVVVESEELGSAAAEPVHSEEEPKEHTPEVENKDVLPAEEHQQAEEIKPVVTESEEAEVEAAEEINSKELNHAGSDTIDSDGQLAHNEDESESKEEAVVKAEPEDVVTNEAVKYSSLREAFLLENGYFEKDSFEKISADKKKSKLVEQISLLVARDVQDPLYEELIRTTATAKNLQEKLQAKYNAVAKKKAGQLLDAKKLK